MINIEDSNLPKYAIGLMSGTSLDAIDVALCEVSGVDLNTDLKLIDFCSYNYNEKLLSKVQKVVSGDPLFVSDISALNVELGYEYADAVKKICDKNDINLKNLFFIASHGQTVFHEATGNERTVRSTLQLGDPAIIAYETGVKTISNFRAKDMAASGEGAPLVPKSELILYKDNYSKVLLNIGGISNITYIPKEKIEDEIIGYDTGPGNMMINESVNHFYNIDYDDAGKLASKGKVIQPLLDELMNHWFISKKPPKSTGRDEFGKDYTHSLIKKYKKEENKDIIHTFTAFTAHSIAKHVKDIVDNGKEVERLIVSGGGVHNNTLLSLLKNVLLDDSIKVMTQEDIGYSSDAKEAIAFVVLANQTIYNRPGNIPSVTGAKKQVVLGSITYPS